MAEVIGSAKYVLDLDDDKFKKGMSGAKSMFSGSVDASQQFITGIKRAGLAIGGFVALVAKEYGESQKVMEQTNAVLESTGGIAGVTADEVVKLANALQKTTGFSDEQVQSAENLLLTFTKIGKDSFPDATRAVLDMSQALGEDLKGSAIRIGKALQDPILGITALRRVGVNFSEDSKKTIQALVDSNQLFEAQKFILKELQTEFGGSAEAYRHTLPGAITAFKNSISDFLEVIGEALFTDTGFIDGLTESIGKFATWISDHKEDIKYFVQGVLMWIKEHGREIAGVILGGIAPAILAMATNFGVLFIKLAPFMILGQIITHFEELKAWFDKLSPAVQVLTGMLTGMATVLLGSFALSMATTASKLAGATGLLGGMKTMLGFFLGPAGLWAMFAGAAAGAVFVVWNGFNDMKKAVDGYVDSIDSAVASQEALLQQAVDAYKSGDLALAERLFNIVNTGNQGLRETAQEYSDSRTWYQKLGDWINPFRAEGGPVSSGTPYMVGERGAEMFVPKTDGMIIPNELLGGGGSTSFNAPVYIAKSADADEVLNILTKSQRLASTGALQR